MVSAYYHLRRTWNYLGDGSLDVSAGTILTKLTVLEDILATGRTMP